MVNYYSENHNLKPDQQQIIANTLIERALAICDGKLSVLNLDRLANAIIKQFPNEDKVFTSFF